MTDDDADATRRSERNLRKLECVAFRSPGSRAGLDEMVVDRPRARRCCSLHCNASSAWIGAGKRSKPRRGLRCDANSDG